MKIPKIPAKINLRISWIAISTIFVIVLVFLSEWIQKEGYLNFPMGFRHITILFLFTVNWFFFGRTLKFNQYYTFGTFLIFIYLILAYFVGQVAGLNYFLGSVFTFLFVIMFYLGSNTESREDSIIKIFKYLLVFIVLMSVGPIVKAIFAGNTLRNVKPGLFREVGAFGSSMNIAVIISLSLYFITGKKKYLYYSIFFSFGVFYTTLKKSILSNIIVWLSFAFFKASLQLKIKLFVYGTFFLIMSMSLTGDALKEDIKKNLDYFRRVGAERHVRTGMYIASYKIASDYFPFGSGMGTFGSLASITHGYSDVYFKYGISKIGYNSPQHVKNGYHTLLDTYWPHILGELGFIGTALFLFIWLFPAITSYHVYKIAYDPVIKGMCFYVVLIIIVMTNEGFTLYTPEIPGFVILHSGISGLCFYHINKWRKINKNIIKSQNNDLKPGSQL
jgi:hypothetical protein